MPYLEDAKGKGVNDGQCGFSWSCVGLGTRGFPQRSLSRPGEKVPAKGSECRQGDEVSELSRVWLGHQSLQSSEECGGTSGSSSGEKISSQVLHTALGTKDSEKGMVLEYL